jgi:clan AA aspartic protease (TIGR02281 family)
MRWIFVLCLMVIGDIAANAAAIDPARIAAIDQAADVFLARAADLRGSGMVPRQSDPGIGPLLDTVYDTRDLSHGPVPFADLPKLGHWLTRLNAVGGVYQSAARKVRDIGLFGAEIGRYYDAALAVVQAIVDSQMAETDAHPDAKLSPTDLQQLTQLRGSVAGVFAVMIDALRAPGLTTGWVHERLTTLSAAARSMARFLRPDELARLRVTTLRLAAQIRDKRLRLAFDGLAVALAEPPRPAPAQIVPATGEIALEHDEQGYSVPVLINGALSVKFIVDSGAGVVALPKDLVEDLTKAGTIAASDLRGGNVYVTADGKRHRGTWPMLRQLDVGGHTVTNVVASVGPANTVPLLGQSFLAKFKSWTLDNQRHVLIITE